MTGRLEETFLRLYNHLEFERDMRERIRDALRYPAFVVVAMAVAIVIINLFVIPAFAKVYAGFKAELPFMTQILIGFSNFMVNQWPLLLAMLASAVIGFKMYTATPAGRYQWDKLKLRLPVAGKIILKATLARFARSCLPSRRRSGRAELERGGPGGDNVTWPSASSDARRVGGKRAAHRRDHGRITRPCCR